MKRGLLIIVASLSLLICVASIGLWIGSYRMIERAFWLRGKGETAIAAIRGNVCFLDNDVHYDNDVFGYGRYSSGGQFGWEQIYRPRALELFRRTGFAYDKEVGFPSYPLDVGSYGIGGPVHTTFLSVPLWFVTMTSLLAAWLCVRRLTARRQRNDGECEVCGYDLRASKDRCPECGTAIPAAEQNGFVAADSRR